MLLYQQIPQDGWHPQVETATIVRSLVNYAPTFHFIKRSCIFLSHCFIRSAAQCPSNLNQDHAHGHTVPLKVSQDNGNSATK